MLANAKIRQLSTVVRFKIARVMRNDEDWTVGYSREIIYPRSLVRIFTRDEEIPGP